MKRREFITLLGGAAAAWPLAARAQQPAMPVIGFLACGSRRPAGALCGVFRQGLNEAGYRRGQNVAFEYRWARESSSIGCRRWQPSWFAASRRDRRACGTLAPLAAKAATKTIPIVFASRGDPVGSGLVAESGAAGRQRHGREPHGADLAGKRLELLKELVPRADRVAVLVESEQSRYPNRLQRDAGRGAATLGQQVQSWKSRATSEIDGAFATACTAASRRVDYVGDPLTLAIDKRIATSRSRDAIARDYYERRNYVEVGGLMCYGANLAMTCIGAPAAMSTESSRARSPPTCRSSSRPSSSWSSTSRPPRRSASTVPPTLLARADEVIE